MLTLAWTFALLAALAAPQAPPKPDPDTILAAARSALGGEAKLSPIKTIVATGRTRQVRGDNLVPIEFEINIELPDKYVRKDEVPAQESGPTSTGFNGDNLLEPLATPPPGRPGGPPPPTPEQLEAGRRARAVTVKQDFARLMLGLLATSFSSYPLTFTYIGQAEAPQGMADVLEGKGPGNLTLRFFVARDTHLPVMVTWQGQAPGGRGRPGGPGPGGPGAAGRGAPPAAVPGAPPPGAPAAAPAAGGPPAGAPPAPPPPPENRIYFADYRDVDGVKFPFRLRRALGVDTIEETTFDRFRLNAKIDAKKFEVKK